MSSVTKDWVHELPWKQQSVLSSSLRGPDNVLCPTVKTVIRWMRSVVQHNADPAHNYMKIDSWPYLKKESWPPDMDALLFVELEYTTVHFITHFLQGLAIIGYNGSLDDKLIAAQLYRGVVERMHLNRESMSELNERLQDKVKEAT